MIERQSADSLREEASQGATQEDNIVSRVNRARKSGLVRIEIPKNMAQNGRVRSFGRVRGGFQVTVEFEKLGEQRQNKCEGDLAWLIAY